MAYSLRNLASISIKLKDSFDNRSKGFRAILVLLLGVLLLDIMGVFIKLLGNEYSPSQMAFARNIFGFIPVIVMLLFSNEPKKFLMPLTKEFTILVLTRGLSITFAQFCFYLALIKLEFATASTLAFASPLFLTALSIPILKPKVGFFRWSAVALGFVGVSSIVGIGSDIISFYSFLPIAAAFCYALSSVSVKLFPENVTAAQIQFFTQVVALFGALIIMLTVSEYKPIDSLNDFLLLSIMGVCGGSGVICLIYAYRLAEPSLVATFEYFGIPFSILLGWLFFSELPLSKLFPGTIFIVLAGFIIIWRENKKTGKS